MRQGHIWVTLIAVGLSFLGGFLLANAFNRSELEKLRTDNEQLRSDKEKSSTENLTLSDEEIKARIAEANQNPDDLKFQRNLGLALYRYASLKQDTHLLGEALPLLERVLKLQPGNQEMLIALGNTHFDSGYFGDDPARFPRAREYYLEALELSPENVELLADIGLTYFLQSPADDTKAIEYFDRTLSLDADHEKALQFMIQAQWRSNRVEIASQYLDRLRASAPKSPSVRELTSLLMKPPPTK